MKMVGCGTLIFNAYGKGILNQNVINDYCNHEF